MDFWGQKSSGSDGQRATKRQNYFDSEGIIKIGDVQTGRL
jgi:hypothetical protein